MQFYGLFLLGILFSVSAMAQTQITPECEVKLEQAEKTDETAVYDECGFGDIATAWNEWAGWVSQKEYKKALYQLCARWPEHPYSDLYCEKSANLGYAPAIAEQGHRLMKKGVPQSAVEYYTRALKIGGLSDEQEGKVAEQLGVYYLNENAGAFEPSKAVAFLAEASKKRSALANNLIGYLFYTGDYGQPQKDTKAFEYLWRSILLGCSSAEENLGIFHLARSGAIKRETAQKYMRSLAFSCDGTSESGENVLIKPTGCACEAAKEIVSRHKNKPYYLVDIGVNTIQLRDKNNKVITAHLDDKLSDGFFVTEIHKTAAILEKEGQRVVLNLVSNMECLDYCKKVTLSDGTIEDIKIKPYRLSFTSQECKDLLYYAPALVDMNRPFIGKKECANSGSGSDDILLKMLQDDNVAKLPQPARLPVQSMRPIQRGVSGQIGIPVATQKKSNKEQTVGGTSKGAAPTKGRPRGVPKKQIRFRVGNVSSGENKK